MKTIACLVAGTPVTAAACVDAQKFERCFCQKAASAILEVAEENGLGTDKPETEAAKKKVRDGLEVLKSRAADFLRKPVGDRYGGPALRLVMQQRNPAPVVEEPSDAPAPAQENAAGATTNELSNDPVRRSAAQVGSADVSPEGSAEIPPELARARPAEGVAETRGSMPPPRVCLVEGCETPLGAHNKSGRCTACAHGLRAGGGYQDCATQGCPNRVQKGRGHSVCSLCRQGVSRHLRPASSSPQPPSPSTENPVHEAPNQAEPEGVPTFDPSKLTIDQLCACALALRLRALEHRERARFHLAAVRAAEFALAGETLPQPGVQQETV